MTSLGHLNGSFSAEEVLFLDKLKTCRAYLYSPISQITNLPHRALQSVKHYNPFSPLTGKGWKKTKKEQQRRDPTSRMDGHTIEKLDLQYGRKLWTNVDKIPDYEH